MGSIGGWWAFRRVCGQAFSVINPKDPLRELATNMGLNVPGLRERHNQRLGSRAQLTWQRDGMLPPKLTRPPASTDRVLYLDQSGQLLVGAQGGNLVHDIVSQRIKPQPEHWSDGPAVTLRDVMRHAFDKCTEQSGAQAAATYRVYSREPILRMYSKQ